MLSDPEQPIPPLPSVPIYPVAPAPLAALEFPIGWLLDHGSAPIQYRSAVDVARLASGPETALSNLPYSFVPALRLAVAQAADGVWNNAMLTVPPQRGDEFEHVGTVHAVRRLVEYGWSKDSPPVYQARRVLFRLLADDNDPALLFEFAPSPTKKLEPESLMAVRQVLREAAAAALAQAGFEADPRLRGAANRIVERIHEFLKSPLAAKPWIRVGNKQVLAPEATPPSIYALHMLAHMPLFRNEHYEAMEALYRWLSHPLPRQDQVPRIGYAIQCRVTTEDPENKFTPDYGKILTYRSAGGFGVRLDGGMGYAGAVITPFYDSLLVKITASGQTFSIALQRMDRALREFRIRGVKTNIPFLENVIHHPDFRSGQATTTLIDTTPELFTFKARRDRATKLLNFLGNITVNGNPHAKGFKPDKPFAPAPVVRAIRTMKAACWNSTPRLSITGTSPWAFSRPRRTRNSLSTPSAGITMSAPCAITRADACSKRSSIERAVSSSASSANSSMAGSSATAPAKRRSSP